MKLLSILIILTTWNIMSPTAVKKILTLNLTDSTECAEPSEEHSNQKH
jgi:hypothetical protein